LNERGRAVGLGGRPLGADSLLLGGPGEVPAAGPRPDDPPRPEAPKAIDPAGEDHGGGRSERLVSALDPLLDFYYRYWFRVDAEGLENIPAEGGALLVCNHSGALPPDAPMIMQAIRNEGRGARPVYMLGEQRFEGFPAVRALTSRLGVVAADGDDVERLLADEGQLALVFPEGAGGTRKVLWQRYRLRRFDRSRFVRTALRARVPIVPIALIGGEEAMPIFAHMRFLERVTGQVQVPFNHAFPHFGPLAPLMYMPAKFRIRFLEPVDIPALPAGTLDDAGAVESIAERIRTRIQTSLDEMLAERRSVWLG
jgi:1-acyl-sn-glycerol-3-phosphate acyltransferase